MKQLLLLFTLLAAALGCAAQGVVPPERAAWMKEMQQYKNDYLAKQLNLTADQRERFMPLYNAMDDQIRALMDETRAMEKQVEDNGAKATELEYEKAAEALYESKGRENEIEMRYFKQFRQILSSKQLFKLRSAEREFTRQLMKHHRNGKQKEAAKAHKARKK